MEVVLTFRCFFFIATSVDTEGEGVSHKYKFLQSQVQLYIEDRQRTLISSFIELAMDELCAVPIIG